jgi:hypothetical protein
MFHCSQQSDARRECDVQVIYSADVAVHAARSLSRRASLGHGHETCRVRSTARSGDRGGTITRTSPDDRDNLETTFSSHMLLNIL